ncbi:MAG: type II toxin-antitoxin system VapC family toxin [Actinomycetota bacterium]|nr:type II toxin-antitoxin system VapC family toxin [Actinomycetota bacterium]
MKLLLDTHVLIWWLDDSPRLGQRARSAMADGVNEVRVSAVSAGEMSLKAARGKLRVPDDLERQIADNSFEELAFTIRHGAALRDVPVHHGDPFDRMLVAQAVCEGLTLVTADRRLAEYDVPILLT